MPAYLGTLGRLIPIRCAAQPVSRADRYTTVTTLEGAVKTQRSKVGRRSWDVSLGLAGREHVAALWGFDTGEWGLGPFVWVTPEAQLLNMLTPEQASCAPEAVTGASGSAGGPLLLPDGSYAGRSFMNSSPAFNIQFGTTMAPVLPGGAVTASAYVLGAGAKVGVSFHTADGTLISRALSTATGNATAADRVAVTAVAPANAAGALVYAAGTVQAARPALTWTQSVQGYGPGMGCPKAIIDGLSHDPRLLTDTSYRATASFTVQEVG